MGTVFYGSRCLPMIGRKALAHYVAWMSILGVAPEHRGQRAQTAGPMGPNTIGQYTTHMRDWVGLYLAINVHRIDSVCVCRGTLRRSRC